MKIYKAYKFRMYPDECTKSKLNSFMGTSRFIYNHYLELKDKYYNELNINYNISDMKKDIKNLENEYPWLKDIDSMASRNTLDDLNRSYTNFFQKRSSHPKFKCKNNHDTYRTTAIRGSYNGKEYSNIKVDLENKMIKLPRLDSIKIRGYRNLKIFDDKKILNATVSKEAGKYYVSVCTEEDITLNSFILRYGVGIDLGVKNLVIMSSGVKYDAMNKTDKYEKKIKGLNRWLTRSKKGGKNREKIKLKLQRAYQKLRNARKYYTHLITKEITDNNDLIAVENLNTNNMIEEASTKNFRKKILDSSMREVLRQIKYKSLWKNKKVIEASRYFKSSQRCSHCGNINSGTKNLSVRKWECSKCHSINDRDINASINILMEGIEKYYKEHLELVK